MREKLIYLNSLYYDYDKLQNYLRKDPRLDSISIQKAKDFVDNLNCKCTTLLDSDYPKRLKLLKKPPWVLYYIGDISLFDNRLISIIGTRTPTKYGMAATADVVRTYNQQNVIISGYGFGIARQALMSGIINDNKVICITSRNITESLERDKLLMKKIANEHLLITEIPPNKKATLESFAIRNKIIGVLSDEVNVIEARANSIILDVVDTALEYGNQINALPGEVYNENSVGTNLLLNEGANMIYLSNVLTKK